MAVERTDELASAALRIVTRDGLSGVTFRAVATESGWSLGAVQKTFRSKSDMIAATLRYAQSSVSDQVSSEPGRPTLADWLIGLVMATLPLDDERRSACLVGIAFADRAPFDPKIAVTLASWDNELRSRLTLLARRAHEEGELSRAMSADALSRAVLAFAAGLASQLLYDPISEDAAHAVVSATIRALVISPS